MQDLMNYITGKHGLGNGALITATTHGDAIDVNASNNGNNSLCFVVDAAVTDGTHTLTLEDSIDGGTTWVTVAAPYLQVPSGQSNVVTSATAAKTILKFGYLGNPNIATITAVAGYPTSTPSGNSVKVRITDTVSGSPSTGAYITAIPILGQGFNQPAA